MTVQRIVGLCFYLVCASDAATGQQPPEETTRQDASATTVEAHTETVRRRDLNGKLVVDGRTVTRRSAANAQEDEVIETYAPYADGVARMALSQRVHRTTTATADGGSYTVEEVEQRSRVAPSDPMRVTTRTVTTVRPIASGRWVSERQIFERDVNGRLRLVATETEETVER